MASTTVSTTQRAKPPSINSIQAMRAVAALAVMSMHVFSVTISLIPNEIWKRIGSFGQSYGHSGVDLFFIISGLIMYIITRGAPENRLVATTEFVIHRVARIYPLFWVTFLFSIFVAGGLAYNLFSLNGLAEITLYVSPQAHPVSWTLPYEVRFYLVVAIILLLARKHLDIVFLIWGVGQLIASTLFTFGFVGFNMFTYVLMTEFSMGLLVGWLVTRNLVFKPLVVLAVALLWMIIACTIVYSHEDYVTPYRHLLYGIPAAMIMYAVITLEQTGAWVPPKGLCRIGDFSYSIYLWHYPLLMYVSRLWPVHNDRFFSGLVFATAIFALTGMVSFISFYTIEKPSIRIGRLLSKMLCSARDPLKIFKNA